MKDNEEKRVISDKLRAKGGAVFITLVQILEVQFRKINMFCTAKNQII